MTRPDHAKAVKVALTDPRGIAVALGLEKGAKRQPRAGIMVCCPHHGERTPSCSITVGPDGTIRVRCFGCDFAGDVFTLLAEVHGLDLRSDFPRVIEIGADLANIRIDDETRERIPAPPRRVAPLESQALPTDAFNRLATDILERCRIGAPDGAEVAHYLRQRRLFDPAEVSMWGALPPPDKQGLLVGALCETHGRDALGRSGLLRERDDGTIDFDRFSCPRHRLLIPWFNSGADAAIETLQRRRIDPGEPKYISTRGRGFPSPYGSELLADSGRCPVVFVEGAVDVLAARTLYAHMGFERVVLGIPGVSNWRPEWAACAAGREAFIAVDIDPAGEAVVDRILADLTRAGATRIRRSSLPSRKDWGADLEARL